jgi:ATP-binding protein involved in chromosome partitioning
MKNAAMHARKRMQEACEFAIERSIGKDYSIEVNVQAMKKAEASKSLLPNIKNTIAVVSGKGGVGKSTVSANLAVGLAKKGFNVGVVDADIYGPSMPIMFDVLHYRPFSREINKKQVIVPAENYGVKILSIGFFAELDEAVVWRGPMAVKALKQLIFDADWGELDYLIIDTPPGTGDVHLSIVQSLPLTGAVVVTTPQPVALADAKKAVAMLKMDNIKVPVLGMVENMSWFTPKNHPEEKYFIFGEDGGENLAKSLSLELLGKVPIVESIRQSGDVGRPAVLQQETIVEKYYNDLCDKLILNTEERNAKLEPTKVVGVEYGDPKCST